MTRKSLLAFTLVEIMIVVAIIGLLATVAMPAFVRARDASHTSICINNLRLIYGAKALHALEARKGNGESVSGEDISPYLKAPFDALIEPAGASYTIGDVGRDPLCGWGGSHALPQ